MDGRRRVDDPDTPFAEMLSIMDMPPELQLCILQHVLVEGIVAMKATCTICRTRGRAVLRSTEWLARGRNRQNMRAKLWRGMDLPTRATHTVIAVHDGKVWSVALSSGYLVSGADDQVLAVRDASCTQMSNECSYPRILHVSRVPIEGVLLSRPVRSWHLALHGHQLAVLGRLVDLSHLHEDETLHPRASGELLTPPIFCPLSSSLATWTEDGRLFLTQGRTVRMATIPAEETDANEDVAAGIRLEAKVLTTDEHGGPPPIHTNAIAAGSYDEPLSPFIFVAVTCAMPDVPHSNHRAITVLTVDPTWRLGALSFTFMAHRAAPIYALATGGEEPGWLASGADDGTIKLWDVAQPSQPSCVLSLRTGAKVWALAMSGSILVSAGEGNDISNINVWSLPDPRTVYDGAGTSLPRAVHLASLRGMPDVGVRSLATDGDRVVAGADDGRLYVWHHDGLPLA